MTKTPIDPQELRRRMYRKAKSDPKHRFWGIFIHITKREVLEKAYLQAKRNGGAPGVDGQTFEDIESSGRATVLEGLRDEHCVGGRGRMRGLHSVPLLIGSRNQGVRRISGPPSS
jgi:RNA-directed DNA polymerase